MVQFSWVVLYVAADCSVMVVGNACCYTAMQCSGGFYLLGKEGWGSVMKLWFNKLQLKHNIFLLPQLTNAAYVATCQFSHSKS